MKKPKMIMIDYGQTLISETGYDPEKGTAAVMQYAVGNKHCRSAQEVQAAAYAVRDELGRSDPKTRHMFNTEIPNHMFTAYLYKSVGVELSLTPPEIDRVFWDAASPGKPTAGIEDFLAFLKEKHIRTGVISNIPYCGEVVSERINRMLPQNDFEFIIATSEYLFRKPHRRIFELALEMADLSADDVWYIGDHYECDVAGSRNAGMFPVWYTGAVNVDTTRDDGVMTVSHWDQLAKALSQE